MIITNSFFPGVVWRRWLALVPALFLWLLVGQSALAAPAPLTPVGDAAAVTGVVQTEQVRVELVADHTVVTPGQTFYLALRQVIIPGWHTYWRNPGDSGEPTRLTWTLPQGVTASDILWPVPHPIPYGPLTNFGYSGQVLLPVTITVPKDAVPASSLRLEAQADWLVCEDICIPQSGVVAIDVPVGTTAVANTTWAPSIASALALTPKALTDVEAKILPASVMVSWSPLGVTPEMADGHSYFFFPTNGDWLRNSSPQKLETRGEGADTRLRLTLDAAAAPDTAEGVLGVYDAKGGALAAYEIKGAPAGSVVASADPGQIGGWRSRANPLPAYASDAAPIGTTKTLPLSALVWAFVSAILGGLILNLMPCVFPILSIKALTIAKLGQEDKAKARAEALVYLAGVVVSFLALAGILLALRAGGEALGWGFQMQSPPFVAALALVFFLISLNLLGLFEVSGSFVNAGQSLTETSGLSGAFFTGVLATLAATPCTAPFMGTALGVAISQPPVIALAIFAALGLGMALPFVVIAYVPGLGKLLPRPGRWMVILREVLAFPMLIAAIWALWVLNSLAGGNAVAVVLLAWVVIGLAIWTHFRGMPKVVQFGAILLAVIAVIGGGLMTWRAPPMSSTGGPQSLEPIDSARAPSIPFDADMLAQARNAGHKTFVVFTADWCISCKVNEAVAIDQPAVQRALMANGVTFMIVDWTRKDPDIAKILADYNRAGVPLYLVFKGDGSPPVILPQFLTVGLVVKALERS